VIYHASDARGGNPPRSRLEAWLVRKLQAGGLKALPRYAPPGACGDLCPEQYAAALLDRLRAAAVDPRAFERAKDDGRAFRSWAEAFRALAV
jgi:hypothetical protein